MNKLFKNVLEMFVESFHKAILDRLVEDFGVLGDLIRSTVKAKDCRISVTSLKILPLKSGQIRGENFPEMYYFS